MTSLGTMRDRIADELDRADLTSQIEREIKSAVAYYERKRFWFNEKRTNFATVNGQEWYTSTDDSDIPYLLTLDIAKIALSSSDKYELELMPYADLEAVSFGEAEDEGQPTQMAYFQKQIRLYPIPDASYSVVLSGIFALGDLSASADTNAWMTDGEALIRARAKRNILRNVIRDPELANEIAQEEAEELRVLVEATTQKKKTGRLMPTNF